MHPGGIVLILCGIDANGDHFDSEMLVFHDGTGLALINPVYWGQRELATAPAL